jgi:hypothetical protein
MISTAPKSDASHVAYGVSASPILTASWAVTRVVALPVAQRHSVGESALDEALAVDPDSPSPSCRR